jgi:hypothetical protein
MRTTTTLRSRKAPLLAATAAGLAALVCFVGAPAFAQASKPAGTTSLTASKTSVAYSGRGVRAEQTPATSTTPVIAPAARPVPTTVAVKVVPKTTTTVAARPPVVLVATRPAPAVTPVRAATPPANPPVRTPTVTTASSADSCSTALAYLAANSAPGFRFECPGYAEGHQAMTCINVAGVCPGAKLIVIATVCSASYMNEASNSWVLSGLRSRAIDPYGSCH